MDKKSSIAMYGLMNSQSICVCIYKNKPLNLQKHLNFTSRNNYSTIIHKLFLLGHTEFCRQAFFSCTSKERARAYHRSKSPCVRPRCCWPPRNPFFIACVYSVLSRSPRVYAVSIFYVPHNSGPWLAVLEKIVETWLVGMKEGGEGGGCVKYEVWCRDPRYICYCRCMYILLSLFIKRPKPNSTEYHKYFSDL